MENKGWRKWYDIVWKIVDKFIEDNITLYSAQTAYFIVVSLIPFAIVLVPILSLLIPDSTFALLSEAIHILPGSLGDYAERILATLFKIPTTRTLFLYILISLWASSKGIMSLQNGLHGIYHITETENYFKRRFRCVGYTFVFLIFILFALGFMVLGNTIDSMLFEYVPFLTPLARFIYAFRFLIGIALFVLVGTFGYKHLASTNCTFRDAFPGVALTTIAWLIFTGLFSIYVTYISQYITLYGSLGALIFLFLWLYFCLLILMVGAEFNVYFAARKERLGGMNLDDPEIGSDEKAETAGAETIH